MQYLFSLILWLPGILFAHPFHVSVTNVDYNASAQSVEITHKIFLNDLEYALREETGKKINLTEDENIDSLIQKYLSANFSISINEKKYNPTYLGKEVQSDAIWFYQEITGIKSFSTVTVKNTVLLDHLDDQTNLINIKKDDKVKSLRLYKDENNGTVKF